MITYLIKRLASGFVLLVLVTTITFVMLFGTAENAALNILGESATDEDIAAFEARLGIDRPLWVQYVDWAGRALRGDLGRSWINGERVTSTLANHLPVTLSIVVLAITVIALLSAWLGIQAAVRGGWVDRFLQVASVIGFSLPNFWLALVLVVIFALNLRWLPATGYVPLSASPSAWLASLTLPVAAIVISGVASISQQIRGAVIDVLRQDYIRTLRARGISPRSVLFRHALRNALPAGLTVLSLKFISLLGGAAIIEKVFAVPGLGLLTLSATLSGDVPVVMGTVITAIIVVVVVNIAIDIIHAWVNPKVRLS